MGFLNPFALIGLLATGIPLLIHLFSQRRLQIVPFSSLEFLKRVERRRMKWLRIRQILLLVLRMLAIAFLFLAMARPIVNGALPFGIVSQGETTALFILDNSYSMGLNVRNQGLGVSDEKRVFDKAKNRALEIIDLLRRGDEGLLILASDRGETIFDEPVRDLNLLKKEIREAPLSFRNTDLRPSLELGLKILQESKKINREIYIISDFQRNGFQSLLEDPLLGQPILAGRTDVRINLIRVGEPNPDNTSLDAVTFSDPLFIPKKPFNLRIQLQHHSGNGIDNSALPTPHSPLKTKLQLFLDGNLRGSREISFDSGKNTTVSFPLQFDDPGYHTGYVQIADDFLEADNQRFFSFSIPKEVNVLLSPC
jgi:hypothetical protein